LSKNPDDTREKLLEATYQLISEKGYMGATTKEIAASAGVSELTLFRKFGKKEVLFEEMLKSYTFLPRLQDLLTNIHELPLGEGLTAIGVRLLETLRERRPMFQILLSEMAHYPEKVRTVYQQMIVEIGTTLESYLGERQARGEVASGDLGDTTRFFLRALVMTFQYESIILKQEMSDESIQRNVSKLVEIFLNGIAEE
jgi:AcrR family transcriptional regulator